MTTYRIALNFEDGVTRIIDCDEDEKVTEAAFRQRINIPMDCRDGVCGTCKCHAEKGEYELEFYLDEAMTEDEAAEGYVLTCQMMPRSDCVVAVPASSAVCKTGAEAVGGEITAIDVLSATAFGLKVRMDRPMAFLPGQYVNITVPGTDLHRSYSFSSAPWCARSSGWPAAPDSRRSSPCWNTSPGPAATSRSRFTTPSPAPPTWWRCSGWRTSPRRSAASPWSPSWRPRTRRIRERASSPTM